MSLIKYIERLQRMDSLISMRATGNPDEFARKMRLRRSTLFQNLQEMKEMGVNIKYSYIRQSYYYPDGKRIRIIFEKTEKETGES
jgi:hypothetical protein